MISIKKNPEKVGKLKVGTSSATPADGEVVANKLTVGDSSANELLVGFESSSQDFGIGANGTNFMIGSSATDLDTGNLVSISSTGNITTSSDGIALKLDGSSNTTRGIFIRNTGGSAHGYLHTDGDLKIIAEDSGKSINFYTADDGTGTARLSIASTGLCTFSNGIAFQSATTGSGTGTGYTLDKYETGTFTLADASGAGITINNAEGKYTRVGNLVSINVNFDIPATSDGTTLNMSGLPFSVPNDNDSRGLVLTYSNKTGVTQAMTFINSSNIFMYDSGGGAVTYATASGGNFQITGQYKV